MNLVVETEFWGRDGHLETLSKSVVFTVMGLDKIASRESVDREKAGRQILGHPNLKDR